MKILILNSSSEPMDDVLYSNFNQSDLVLYITDDSEIKIIRNRLGGKFTLKFNELFDLTAPNPISEPSPTPVQLY